MAVSQAGQGVWNVHSWDATKVWGWHNTQTGSSVVARYTGDAFWSRGHWKSDWWLTW